MLVSLLAVNAASAKNIDPSGNLVPKDLIQQALKGSQNKFKKGVELNQEDFDPLAGIKDIQFLEDALKKADSPTENNLSFEEVDTIKEFSQQYLKEKNEFKAAFNDLKKEKERLDRLSSQDLDFVSQANLKGDLMTYNKEIQELASRLKAAKEQLRIFESQNNQTGEFDIAVWQGAGEEMRMIYRKSKTLINKALNQADTVNPVEDRGGESEDPELRGMMDGDFDINAPAIDLSKLQR